MLWSQLPVDLSYEQGDLGTGKRLAGFERDAAIRAIQGGFLNLYLHPVLKRMASTQDGNTPARVDTQAAFPHALLNQLLYGFLLAPPFLVFLVRVGRHTSRIPHMETRRSFLECCTSQAQ